VLLEQSIDLPAAELKATIMMGLLMGFYRRKKINSRFFGFIGQL